MKYIILVCKPSKKTLLLSLLEAAGIPRVMVSEVGGYGNTEPREVQYRGTQFTVKNAPRLKVEIAVNNEFVPVIFDIASKISEGEEISGGKVFVLPMEDCYHPRTGEYGKGAI